MTAIRLEGITKSFSKSAPILSNLDLEVRAGELLTIVGPSGAGKTTLLRLIAGLETPDSGKVIFGNRDVTSLPPESRDVGMVFQSHALYPHLNVHENLSFPLKLRNAPKAQIEQRVSDVACLLELTSLLQRKPAELSGGEAQRVALGRALIRKPAALLMDEPLSSLPPDLRVRLRGELLRLHTLDPRPTIYVTHDHEEALALGQRVAVLHGGSIQQIGTAREVYERPANRFVASFVGRPPMNFITANDRVVGVRPEHLEICAAPNALVNAHVKSFQYLGGFSDVTVRYDGGELILRHLGARIFIPNEALSLRATPEHIHHFEPQTGKRVDS